MVAGYDAINAARRESIDRLNAQHARAREPNTPTRQNNKQASQSGTLRAATQKPAKAVENKKPERSDQTLRDVQTCKARPEKNRGMGTGRAFVPWCGRRG